MTKVKLPIQDLEELVRLSKAAQATWDKRLHYRARTARKSLVEMSNQDLEYFLRSCRLCGKFVTELLGQLPLTITVDVNQEEER